MSDHSGVSLSLTEVAKRHTSLTLATTVLLSGLCRQMQKEASDVVYSTKNTFFVRGGDVGWSIPRPFPPLKRLDVNFDMRDIFENSAYTLDCVKSWHDRLDRTPGVTPFEELTDAERWNLLHEEKLEGIWHVWSTKMSTCTTMNDLDLLRLDLTNCRCPAGCCRMGPHLLGYLEFRPDYSLPKRIEIVGIIETEKKFCKELLTEGGDIPLDHIFFVDRQGCTCRVSLRICRTLVLTTDNSLRKGQAATPSPKCWLEYRLKAFAGFQSNSRVSIYFAEGQAKAFLLSQEKRFRTVHLPSHLETWSKRDRTTVCQCSISGSRCSLWKWQHLSEPR